MNEKVKLNSFARKNKTLAIDAQTIRFQNTVISKEEVTAIKYWVSAIEVYRFNLGQRFHIGLQTNNQQLDLLFESFFELDEDYFTELCERIIAEIWEPITDRLYHRYKESLLAGATLDFHNCQISKAGVLIQEQKLLTTHEKLIAWEDLHYENKYDRLELNNGRNQAIWTNLYFKDSWNIEILTTLLDWITKENGLAELTKQ